MLFRNSDGTLPQELIQQSIQHRASYLNAYFNSLIRATLLYISVGSIAVHHRHKTTFKTASAFHQYLFDKVKIYELVY